MSNEFGGIKKPDTSKKTRRASMNDERFKTKSTIISEMLEAHQALTTFEKITKLDQRLGVGIGASKERARLNYLLDKENLEKAAKTEASLQKEEKKSKKQQA